MISEEIKLYKEEPVIQVNTVNIPSYTYNPRNTFSVFEITSAVVEASNLGFKVGKYFQFKGEQVNYLIKRLETRIPFVDVVKGGPGVVIAQRVGQMVECAFSLNRLTDAEICLDFQ